MMGERRRQIEAIVIQEMKIEEGPGTERKVNFK